MIHIAFHLKSNRKNEMELTGKAGISKLSVSLWIMHRWNLTCSMLIRPNICLFWTFSRGDLNVDVQSSWPQRLVATPVDRVQRESKWQWGIHQRRNWLAQLDGSATQSKSMYHLLLFALKVAIDWHWHYDRSRYYLWVGCWFFFIFWQFPSIRAVYKHND